MDYCKTTHSARDWKGESTSSEKEGVKKEALLEGLGSFKAKQRLSTEQLGCRAGGPELEELGTACGSMGNS